MGIFERNIKKVVCLFASCSSKRISTLALKSFSISLIPDIDRNPRGRGWHSHAQFATDLLNRP
jgi:hypothetical protein